MKNDKQELCEIYKTYLEIIYHFGNKVMVNKQLFEVVEAMGLEKNKDHFYFKMNKLVSAGIIEKSTIYGFSTKPSAMMYKLKKYAIRFLEDKSGSGSVGAVPKNTTERLSVSLFKTSYILTKLIPTLQKQKKEITIATINQLLKQYNSSLLFKKNQGLTYLNSLNEFLDEVLNKRFLETVRKDMSEIVFKKEEGLLKGRKSTDGKGSIKKKDKTIPILESADAEKVLEKLKKVEPKNREKKSETIVKYNFDSMIFAHIYVAQIMRVSDVLTATVLLYDVGNRQSVHKMLRHVSCIYQMFQFYFLEDVHLRVGIVAFDEAGEINMSSEAKKEVKHGQTKEIKGKREDVTLKNWGVDDSELKNISIIYTHYDLTNRYFDGIKHLNLKR